MKQSFYTLRTLCGAMLMAGISLLSAMSASAQVTGTKTIGIDYPDLASAITDLNTSGILGSVIINVPGAYTETAPAGGYLLGSAVLNASTSATSTLTIQKNGGGANPLLTAPVGTSTTVDGIFYIQGTDYVTISAIDLTEAVTNTTATTWMERGYALVKLQNTAPFDGCQNVTIRNCTITLNRSNTPTVGIYAGNHIATATTALTLTATTDAMSDCSFYGNTIQNCVTGISLRGFAAPAPYALYDQNNDIGGTSGTTGNTIRNYGGTTSGSGINLQYQNNANTSYNNVNNTAGGGIAATTILYGIYTQNGTNSSVTVTNNTIELTMGTTGSSLYGVNSSCPGTGTVNVNNNRFTASGGSTGAMYMIYTGSAITNVNTNNNTFYNINVATTGSLYLVYYSTAATPAYITCNNNMTDGPSTPYINKTGAGGTVAGYYNNAGSGSGSATLINNNFSNITLAGNPTFYGVYENNGGTGQNKSARYNTVSNITSAGGTLYGLWMGYSATEIFSNNVVSFLNAGSGNVYGIYVNTSSNIDTVVYNRVHNLSSTGGNLYGIYINAGTSVNVYLDTVYALSTTGASGLAYGIYQSGGTNVEVFRNKIYDIAGNGASGRVSGIYFNAGITSAYNNLIGDLRTPNYSGTGGTQLSGIYINGGVSSDIYYNSVYLNATSIGATFGSCAIYSSTTPLVTLRNNIFANLSTPAGGELTVAYRRNGTSLTNYQAASNNNLFYAGAPSTTRVIFYDGTTSYISMGVYRPLVAPADANSVTENPPFVSITGSSPSFLHISTSVPTQIESGAVNIAGITTDADSTIRQGNPGYTGSGSAPDIGAVEGNYLLTDRTGPSIAYTVLPDGCTTGDRTFTATISDATGVPVSGGLVPRVYYRKGAGPWFSSPGTLVTGSTTSGTWSFTISAATMGGVTVADVISYFVIAQDVVSPANKAANPGAGLVATDVNTISVYPTSPNTYTILPVLSGTYTVGVGMTYTTITDAVNAYNTSCISGNVVFQLTDATYLGEIFPITINDNGSAGSGNTLTIMPAVGVTPAITGSSASGIFVLNGADYVTIDGANTPLTNSVCPAVSSARDMTITNTSTSTTSAVVWIQTATGGDSATHNTIRNCNIVGSGNTRTLFGIGSGGTTIGYTSLGTNNNSNTIENNSIIATQTGIYSKGASAADKNTGTVINLNHMDGTAPDNLRNNGIFTGFEDGIVISGNVLANITNGASNDIIGINLGFGNNATGTGVTTGSDVTNATVTNNKLDNITQTNTYTVLGIAVAGVTTGTNLIANNMISGLLGKGTGGDFTSGIFIGGAAGGTTRVYYNTVEISGTTTGATYPAFAISVSGTNPILDLKNNIFVNTATTGSGYIFAIGLAYSVYTNLSSDHNNFYSVGANMGTVGSLAGTGTPQPTLAVWQSTTGGDANSKDILPVFTSPSDLHLTTATANIPLMNTGTPVSVITDFDCAARSSTTPDIGLNEFFIPLCSSVSAGPAVPDNSAFCNSGSATISLPSSTVGVGISYQWQESADSVSWSAIPGATFATYTTPVLTTTTYYRAVLSCFYSGLTDSASVKITINPLPVITVTPDGGAICATGTGIDMTASGGVSYTWSPASGLSTTTGPLVTANPPATTIYTVTGTDANGCVNTHASTVTVTNAPAAFTITPSPVTVCEGSPAVMISAIGAALPSSGPDSAASGSISVTVPDALAAGTSTPLTISGVPTGATITGVSVRFNITMTYDGDLALNLTAPNGRTLNLVNRRGAGGDNFVNTVVTSAGGITFASSSAPFTNTYTADAALTGGITSLPVNTQVWSDLYSVPNGTWTFSARDFAGGDVATITSWTIIVDYTYDPAVTWAPVAGLYTDPGATVPYVSGDTATTVYAQPDTTTVYTATLALGACSNATAVTVNVTPLPDADSIYGPTGVCRGSSVTLSDTVAGGTWYASNANATVSGTGVVNGITPGLVTVFYVVTNSCGNDTAFKYMSVDLAPVAGVIVGPSALCQGTTISLTNSSPGGTWSSSNANASVGSTGIVTGVSPGTSVITYNVTNGCGTAIDTHPITINPAPDADTILGPTTLCEGSSTYLYDAAPGGVWVSATGRISVTTTGFATGVSGGTDTVYYIVTNSCGTDSAAIEIFVDPLPTVSPITGPTSVCVGSSIALSDTTSGGIWRASNPSAIVSPTGIVTGITAGVDTISYEVANACGTNAALHIVTVNPLPDAGVISGPSSVCVGTSVTLVSTAPGGVWSSSNPSATVSTTGVVTGVSTGTAIISYTSAVVCGTDVAVYPIIVNPSPNIYNVSGGGTYCAGGAGVHIGVSNSDVGVSYQLYNGSSPVGSPLAGTGAPLDFGLITPAGSYTVIASDPTYGCAIPMFGTAVIYVNPTVPPTVSISASSDTVCTGTSVTFTAIPVNGGATPSYQWKVNGVNTGTGVTYTYTPSPGDIVSVTITSSPCALPDTGSSSISILVTGYTYPSVSIAVSPGTTVCEGAMTIFTAVPVFGGSSPTFLWIKNGVNVATGPSYNYVPMNGDAVRVYMTSSYNCRLADSAISAPVTITTVRSVPPTVTILASPGTAINPGQLVTLTAVATGAVSPTFQWFLNNAPIPGATNATYSSSTFAHRDSVTCIVVSNNACRNVGAAAVIITVGNVGVGTVTQEVADVRLLPNPNKGIFSVRGYLGTAVDKDVTIEITDMLGQVVYKEAMTAQKGNIDKQIRLGNTLANGMYLLTLHSGGNKMVFHFVLEQ